MDSDGEKLKTLNKHIGFKILEVKIGEVPYKYKKKNKLEKVLVNLDLIIKMHSKYIISKSFNCLLTTLHDIHHGDRQRSFRKVQIFILLNGISKTASNIDNNICQLTPRIQIVFLKTPYG